MNPVIAGIGAHVAPEPVSTLPPLAPGWHSRTDVVGTAPNVALTAARAALLDAGISAGEVELILVGTTTPDSAFPATACILQTELGAPPAGSFDILAAEAGFLYALGVAERYVRSGAHAVALVVGADSCHPLVPIGPGQAHVTQSAAGAVVLARDRPGPVLLGCRLGASNGQGPRAVWQQLRALLTEGGKVHHALVPPGSVAQTPGLLAEAGIHATTMRSPLAPAGAPNAYLPIALARAGQAGDFHAGETILLLAGGAGGVVGAAALRWEVR
jgi:3-oxoacyl-[acyl-carrier-protein] synthase III